MPPSRADKTIAIAANFAAEPVEESIKFWLRELALPYRVSLAPLEQVFQQLLDPASLLSTNGLGVNIVLVGLEHWHPASIGFRRDDEARRAARPTSPPTSRQTVAELISAVKSAAMRSAQNHFVFLCRSSPRSESNGRLSADVDRWEREIVDGLEGTAGVCVVPSGAVEELYPSSESAGGKRDADEHRSREYFAALGTLIARKVHALHNPPLKVIAVDCDETLWSGVCAEDGPYGVRIDAPRRAMQEFLIAQHDAGRLVCLCSKNSEQDVFAVFDQRPDMLLSRDHLAAWRINWRPKSANLSSLADELRLGVDSFALLDDSPLECAEVESQLGDVLTVLLPEDASHLPQFLRHHWAFDRVRVTEEDRRRGQLYRQDRQRKQFRNASISLEQFLADLNLQIEINPSEPDDVGRISQLTQRTNQFNLTNRRRNEPEMREIIESGPWECLSVRVSDRFGDYGLVGVVVFRPNADHLAIDTFLLSCRALSRGVEHRMLARLGQIAAQRGLLRVDVPFTPSSRNKPALDFLRDVGSKYEHTSEQGTLFRLPASAARAVRYRPAQAPRATSSSRANDRKPTSSARFAAGRTRTVAADAAGLRRVACELYDVERILKSIDRSARTARPQMSVPYVAPRTPAESRIAEIWSAVLGIEPVGVDDNFFELGGHSLSLTQVMSRLEGQFRNRIAFKDSFAAPTVAGLAAVVAGENGDGVETEQFRELLKYVSDLSDEEAKLLLESDSQTRQTRLETPALLAAGGGVEHGGAHRPSVSTVDEEAALATPRAHAHEQRRRQNRAPAEPAAGGGLTDAANRKPADQPQRTSADLERATGSRPFPIQVRGNRSHPNWREDPREVPPYESLGVDEQALRQKFRERRSAKPPDAADPNLIRRVAVQTCNRPEALQRGLSSYLDNFRRFSRTPDVTVIDDSKQSAQCRANFEILDGFQHKSGGRLLFAGREHKRRFAEQLARHGDIPADVVDFALFGGSYGLPTFGANANAVLLECSGELTFCVDDDTLGRVASAPEPSPGMAFTSGGDPAGFCVFDDRTSALNALPAAEQDILRLHEALLGRGLADVVRQAGGECPLDFSRSNPDFQQQIRSGQGRVLITSTGLLGDCAWGAPFGYWTQPVGHLLYEDESHERLVRSESAYRKALTSREILRVVDRPSISDMTFCMGTFLGLDNRNLLPPFLPVQRGQDVVFGVTVRQCFPDGYFGHLPWCLLHAPVETRKFSAGEQFRTASGIDTLRVVLECLESFELDAAVDEPADRMRELGRHLVDLASQPEREFDRFLQERVRAWNDRFVEILENRLSQRNHEPSYWAADVKRYIELLVEFRDGPDYSVPLDLVAGRDLEAARQLTRELIHDFGRLLSWWPQFIATTASLRRKGITLAEGL